MYNPKHDFCDEFRANLQVWCRLCFPNLTIWERAKTFIWKSGVSSTLGLDLEVVCQHQHLGKSRCCVPKKTHKNVKLTTMAIFASSSLIASPILQSVITQNSDNFGSKFQGNFILGKRCCRDVGSQVAKALDSSQGREEFASAGRSALFYLGLICSFQNFTTWTCLNPIQQ